LLFFIGRFLNYFFPIGYAIVFPFANRTCTNLASLKYKDHQKLIKQWQFLSQRHIDCRTCASAMTTFSLVMLRRLVKAKIHWHFVIFKFIIQGQHKSPLKKA